MSRKPSPLRQIVCEVCGRSCRAERKDRDICRMCVRKEPSVSCSRCGRMTHRAAPETGQCPRCTRVTSRSEGVCAHCSRTRIIFNQEAHLCHTCHKVVQQTKRYWEKQTQVKCTVCGEIRVSALYNRAICRSCWKAEQYGHHCCSRCGKLKLIYTKSKHLCKQCDKDRLAPEALRRYIANFMTPHPYNKVLFDLLATTIDWESVTEKTYRLFRTFGRFLQTRQLSDPLTWEAIEEALPALGPTNRTGPKQIRASLLEVGHLLVARGQLESRETYLARRSALLPVGQAPQHMQALLYRYTTWLWGRRSAPANVRDHMEVLTSFWAWGEQRGVRAPEEVQTSHINDYLLQLYWHWQCSLCQRAMTFYPGERCAPRVCTHCGAIGSLAKEKRYAQNTVRQHRAKLLVFFDWLKMNRMVIVNPVQHKTPAPSPTIQHYSPEVIKQLCGYISEPDSDPVEAFILYLIIFHALTLWELRHVMLPTVLPLHRDMALPGLAESYYVIVERPAPSLGDRSPGRPDVRLDFPAKAAPWLKPLLERFELQRQQVVRNPKNRYLFITPATKRHNTPVGKYYLWNIVRRASLRVLDAACNPNTLRKTAGVIFADRAGAGILHWMGWEDQQAFAYTWAAREMIRPQQPGSSQAANAQPGAEPGVFPSPKERTRNATIKCATSTD
jgi:hypothetical protein